jgi:hypothetical protein
MELKGGANLFIRIELLPSMTLPRGVEGRISVNVKRGEDHGVLSREGVGWWESHD